MRRISIAHLMGFVAFWALGFAALRYPNPLSVLGMRLLTFGAIGYAILGVLYRQGAKRAARVGFTLFATGCLVSPFLYGGMNGPDDELKVIWCLFTLGSGMIGSFIAVRLYDTRDQAGESTAVSHEQRRP